MRTKLQARHVETGETSMASSVAWPQDRPEQLAGGGQFVADFGEAACKLAEVQKMSTEKRVHPAAAAATPQHNVQTSTTVSIRDRNVFVSKRFFVAKDMAEGFGIDTSAIAQFDKNALIEKMVFGPSDVLGKWDLCAVVMAFAPTLYGLKKHATEALKKTSNADYPSRIEVQMPHNNVSLLTFCTSYTNLYQVETHDLVQIFHPTFNSTNFCTRY